MKLLPNDNEFTYKNTTLEKKKRGNSHLVRKNKHRGDFLFMPFIWKIYGKKNVCDYDTALAHMP